jgi:adenosylmethionine-8-amino-7-oxononanoate aminotransferase
MPGMNMPSNLPDQPDRATLERWDANHLWHPFSSPTLHTADPPLIIDRAEGCWLIDLDGNRYLDGTSSLWCNIHGHRVPELDLAIRNQLDRVAHSTLLGASHAPAIVLARRLAEIAPSGLDRVFFSDDGATAVESALKMSFQYQLQRADPKPGKSLFLSLRGAYHGDTLGAVGVGDLGLFHDRFGPLRVAALHACQPACHRCPLNLKRLTCGIACADEAARLVRKHADQLAAVIIEPGIQGAAGMIPLPDGYLTQIRDVTRQCDVHLIADEVATGFYRTGSMFACDVEKVSPDFLCLAKGLTGGYLPLAATLTTSEIHAAFAGSPEAGRGFYHGHTYTGNPLGAAVALANLELMARPGFAEHVAELIVTLEQELRGFQQVLSVGDIRQRGLMAGVEIMKDRASGESFPSSAGVGRIICRWMRQKGVLLRPLGDTIVIMPPLAASSEDIRHICQTLMQAIRAFENGGQFGKGM